MSFASQTNSGFVNSIQTPTDTVPNAIGLSDIESIRANLTNVQKIVNFDTKAVYVNIIAKYDKNIDIKKAIKKIQKKVLPPL